MHAFPALFLALASIISSIELMSLAYAKNVPEVLGPAQARYTATLHSVKLSIEDPARAGADETLMIVLLMGLYEDKDASSDSVERWIQHIHGALALINLRGKNQLKTSVGRQLIVNLCTSTITNCLVRHSSVP